MFVEFADQLIQQRADAETEFTKEHFRAAIIAAGQQRFTPIFLTTATTVGGLIPLATAGGPLWVGMAWLLIFGLMFATLLTLFIIPAVQFWPFPVEDCGRLISTDALLVLLERHARAPRAASTQM